MFELMKMLPLIASIGGVATVSPEARAKMERLFSYVKVVSVQQEVNTYARMIYLDTIDETQPKPEDFPNYIYKMTKKREGETRDVAKDFWETNYKLEYFRTRSGGRKFIVSSAGPDQVFGTNDDIIAGQAY